MSNYIYTNGQLYNADELMHYGVPGMKWGHRKARITVGTANANRRSSQSYQNYQQAKRAYKDARKAERSSPEAKAARAAKVKRAAKIGAVVAGTALAAYGAYKVNKWVKSTNCKIAAERGHNFANEVFAGSAKRMGEMVNAGKITSGTVRSGAAQRAVDYANRAANDNFVTAARNVINYKRGGGNIGNLRSVQDWASLPDQMVEFARRRR